MTLLDLIFDELERDAEARERLRDVLHLADVAAGRRTLNAKEAAERLGVTPRTLLGAAREGRVPGAHKSGPKFWAFPSEGLRMLPPSTNHLGESGPGRVRRQLEPSATVQAIRDTGRRAA